MKELQRARGLTTGRLDARFSGWSYDLLGEYAEYDPQDVAITGPFTAAFNNYVRDELKFGQDKVYHTGSDEAGNNWDWKHAAAEKISVFPGSPNVEGDLIQAMLANPHLQVEVETASTTWRRRSSPPNTPWSTWACRKNCEEHSSAIYDAGHMMYLRDEDLAKLKSQHRRLH